MRARVMGMLGNHWTTELHPRVLGTLGNLWTAELHPSPLFACPEQTV